MQEPPPLHELRELLALLQPEPGGGYASAVLWRAYQGLQHHYDAQQACAPLVPGYCGEDNDQGEDMDTDHNCNNDEETPQHNFERLKSALTFCVERLHQGQWFDARASWKFALQFAALLFFYFDLFTLSPSSPSSGSLSLHSSFPRCLPHCLWLLHIVDFVLILGGDSTPWSSKLFTIASILHEHCTTLHRASPSTQPHPDSSSSFEALLHASESVTHRHCEGCATSLDDTCLESTSEGSASPRSSGSGRALGPSSSSSSSPRGPIASPRENGNAAAMGVQEVPRLPAWVTAFEFRRSVVPRRKPVIITGAALDWPAVQKWAPVPTFSGLKWEYLRAHAGLRLVPLETGRHYMAAESGTVFLPLGSLLDALERRQTRNGSSSRAVSPLSSSSTSSSSSSLSSSTWYLVHPLLTQIPELQRDVEDPAYCGSCEADPAVTLPVHRRVVFFGGTDTGSNLHCDKFANCHVQLVGCKYWRLYDPRHTTTLYPHTVPVFANTSQVVDVEQRLTTTTTNNTNIDQPDSSTCFPGFAQTPYYHCVLRPGDLLYLPPAWWHYTRNLEPSVSVAFLWYPNPGGELEPASEVRELQRQGFLGGGGADPHANL